MHDIEAVEVGEAVLAVLRTVLDILVEFIGEDLTFRVVHDVWLNVPLGEPRRRGNPDSEEAAS